MLAFVLMMAAAAASPILVVNNSASHPLQKSQVIKGKQHQMPDGLQPEIDRDNKRPKRVEVMSDMPLPIPARLQPPPFVFVLPATTTSSGDVYEAQFETSEKMKELATPAKPDPVCKNCPKQLGRQEKVLSSNVIMSCCGALLEPVDPFPDIRKDVTKRINFGNIYSYKWEKKKRQSNGKCQDHLIFVD